MSIINDALKKAQKTISPPKAQAKKRLLKIYPFYITVLIIGVIAEVIIFSFLLRAKEKPAALSPAARQAQIASVNPTLPVLSVEPIAALPAPEKKASPVLSLNGIFFSENKGYYALINNRIAKAGDNIDGAEVKSINLEEVQLTFDGKMIRLRN